MSAGARLGGATLVLALVLALALTPLPAATTGATAAPTTTTVVREYGDGPFVVPPGVGRVRVLFHGGAGDRVRLTSPWSCPVVLRRPGHGIVASSSSPFWRLPARDTYAFVYRLCPSPFEHTLQLEKLVTHRLVIGEPRVSVPHRLGYADAVALRVPDHGRIQVWASATSDRPWRELVLPDGTSYRLDLDFSDKNAGDRLAFEAGRRVSWYDGLLPRLDGARLRMRAGDRVLLLSDGGVAAMATRARRVTAEVDADPVTVLNRGAPYRETEVLFEGAAGDWVHLERAGDPVGPYLEPLLVGPHGYQFVNPYRFHPYWRLPTDGTYRLVVPTGAQRFEGTVRVRRMHDPGIVVPTDGTSVTLEAPTPGQWTIAHFDMPTPAAYTLHVESATASAGWVAWAEYEERFSCDWYGPLGCSGFTYVQVDGDHPSSDQMSPLSTNMGTGPRVLVLAVPPDGTGGATLSLRPWTAPTRTTPTTAG